MSWWIGMEIDTGGSEKISIEESVNCTYNLSPMFYECFDLPKGLDSLHGISGYAAEGFLKEAIERMKTNPEKYEKMEPDNGWGSYGTALEVLETLLGWSIKHSKALIYIH